MAADSALPSVGIFQGRGAGGTGNGTRDSGFEIRDRGSGHGMRGLGTRSQEAEGGEYQQPCCFEGPTITTNLSLVIGALGR